jgi:hypothetical protein
MDPWRHGYGYIESLRIVHGGMETWTWRYGPGDIEIWKHRDMEIWKHGDMEIWRHGDMRHRDMETCDTET